MKVESCPISAARRVAAMLDIDPETVRAGATLPRGWQFILLAADTRRSAIRDDGFPGLGVPMSNNALPRLMLLGRTVEYRDDIPLGANLQRASAVRSTSSRAMGDIVTVGHELFLEGAPAPSIVETQTYLLFDSRNTYREEDEARPVHTSKSKTIVPDETLLFQYSALCFNSHKIHIDKRHAREVEGFPDLVVNGGLATLLLTEFLRIELASTPRSWKVRHLAPLFCGRAITLGADRTTGGWHLRAFDDKGKVAVEMEAEIQ